MDRKSEARPGSLEVLHDCSVTWRHMAPAGVALEDCRHPAYWKNVVREASQQRVVGRHAWNRIEILAEDGTWEAELRVLSAADGLVHTRLIREWHAETTRGRKPAVPDDYQIEHIPANGWRVLDPTGDIIAANVAVEEQAIRAAAAHARKAKGDS